MTATYSLAPSAPQEIEPPPLLKFSFLCFCIFNLAYYSRFFEWQLAWLHVPMITSVLALAGAAMDGRLLTVFGAKIGMCMALLTTLYGINVPFSSWKGSSAGVFTGDWLKAFTAFIIAGAVVFNFRQCRTALHSVGWGSAIAGLLMNLRGSVVEGRLTLSHGTLGNSNEGAFDLLLGLPFLWLMLKDSRSNMFKKLVVAALMVNNVVAMGRTGSRGGLIGFAVLMVLWFIRSSMGGKMVMALASILLIAGGLVFLPHDLKLRYATIFSQSTPIETVQNAAEERLMEEAAGSSFERRKLFMNSLMVTMSHPLLGCGIGQFGSYMAGIESAAGQHSAWQGTHNTYTQISSEAGIPALIVFVTMIVFSLRGVQALLKRAKKFPFPSQSINDVINVSVALTGTLVVYSVGACFDYIAYSPVLPVLAGFAVALIRCGKLELDRLETAPAREQAQFLNLYPVSGRRVIRPATY